MISERDIEQVLNRADIVDVVERCGVHLGRGNKACCPFHNEKTPSFHVNPRTQTWHCFGGCPQGDNGGDAISFVMKYKNLSFPEAVKDLAQQYGITIEETRSTRTAEEVAAQHKKESMLAVNQWAAKFYAEAITADNDKAKFALSYAIDKRGWGAEYVGENGIGFADGRRDSLYQAAKKEAQPIDLMLELGLLRRDEHGEIYDFYRDRLMIPIRDRFRRVIGFTARALGESKAKYINSPTSEVYEKKETIFGIDNAITLGRREDIFYLVEGAPDVIKLQAIGVANTVASLGGAWSVAHFEQLKRHASRVCFIPDADPPKSNEKLGPGHKFVCANGKIALTAGLGVTVKEVPLGEDGEKQDPDSYITNVHVLKAIEEKDFIIWYAEKLFDGTETTEAKAEVVKEITQLLAQIDSDVKVQMLLKQLQGLYSDKTIWKSALTAAKKTKKEDEVRQAADREKAIDKEHYKKYGFYTAGNSYWSIGKEGNETRWSNFIIEPMYHIKDVTMPRRIFRIRNNFGHEEIIVLNQEDLCSLAKFKQKVEGLGNYVWLAKDAELTKLKLYIYEVVTEATEVIQLGWQQKGFWAFGNGIWYNGKWYTTDDYGVVKLDPAVGNYYLPANSKMFENDHGIFQFERQFVHLNLGTITLHEAVTRLVDVYGMNGKIGFCFLLATLFRDVVFGTTGHFPILNLFGKIASGKSAFGKTLMSFFVMGYSAPNIENATIAGLTKTLEQSSNALVHIDEYKNAIDYKKVEFLKGLWDGVGRTRMKLNEMNRSEVTEVKAGVIMSGQEMPTADIALFSRVLFLRFDTSTFTDEEDKRYKELKAICNDGLTHLTLQILQYRNKFESDFPGNYRAAADDIQIGLDGEQVLERIRQNWVIPLASLRTLQGVLDIPLDYKDMLAICIKNIIMQNKECSTSNEISTFWNVVSVLNQSGQIFINGDFKIKYVKRFKTDTTNVIEWSRPKPVLLLCKGRVFNLYQRNGRLTGAKTIPDDTLDHYLKNTKEFIGIKKSVRFHSIIDGRREMVTVENNGTAQPQYKDRIDRAYCFDYEMLNENYGINLEEIVSNGADDDLEEPHPEPQPGNIFEGVPEGEAPY